MKLHHLRLRGIGPFAGTVEIDFAALGASGMFLLEGPTGSGKSTILDAVVYALYGRVAGTGASGDRIRSQFAPPAEPSVIELIFETGSGIYRVRRGPEFYRPSKRRGGKPVKEQATALLWRIGSPDLIPAVIEETTDGGEPLATRIPEVSGEIQRALGLSLDQFTQTVLLPQNEFARFLRAGSGERQQVLQRVFGTEIYQDVEKQLEEMRKSAKRDVDAATGTLGRAVARFVEAARPDEAVDAETVEAEADAHQGADAPDGAGASTDGEDSDGSPGSSDESAPALPPLATQKELEEHAGALRLDALSAASDAHVERARRIAERSRDASDAAQIRVDEARTRAEASATALTRIDRRRQLDALAQRLAEQAPHAEQATTRLARDEAARPVADVLRRRDAARARADEKSAALTDLAGRVRAEHAEIAALLDANDPLSALDASADDDQARAGALADLVALEAALEERSMHLAARATAIKAAAARLADLEAVIAARPEARAALVQKRETAQTAAGALSELRVAEEAAGQRLGAAREAAAKDAALETARETEKAALTAAQRAAGTEADLRRRRLAGIAAELAVDLPDGEACPVCGSVEHPHLATPTEGAVTAEQVDAAEADRQRADAAHRAAEQKRALLESERDALLERAGGLDVQAATAAHSEAAAAAAGARAAAAEAARLDGEIARHDQKTTELGEQRSESAVALERERTTQNEASAALEKDRARVADARGEAPSIAARRATHLDRARAADQLRDALREKAGEAARAAELASEATTAREAAEFEDDDAVRAAVLGTAERERLGALVSQRAIDTSRLADGMTEEGIVETDASDDALAAATTAVGAAREQLVAAAAQAREAGDRSARAVAVAESSAAARRELEAAMRTVRHVSDRAGVVVRVADLATARSADGKRIPLSTFVLMRRFEDVVEAANARLAMFSGTDLELLRDDGQRGARKTGLDLLVLDRRTDQTRVPETLSGGETFFVSLALALGLADIVTAEAGGVRMETLFIDEGFGSLDPQTLESVVSEIGRLSRSGRTIGIVSHVGDLKSQIAEQIHVRRGEKGRSTATVTA